MYQRTTDAYHEETARRLWQMCADKGDIYLNEYEGWYNEREETFVSQSDAEAAAFKVKTNQCFVFKFRFLFSARIK